MAIRVGINGFGRIGRNFFRAAKQAGADLDFVAANDLGSVEQMAHLLEYDSVIGRWDADIAVVGDGIKVNGETIKILAERDPKALPWGELGVDVVVESTGIFTSREKAAVHLEAGAPFVIVSAPSSGGVCSSAVLIACTMPFRHSESAACASCEVITCARGTPSAMWRPLISIWRGSLPSQAVPTSFFICSAVASPISRPYLRRT